MKQILGIAFILVMITATSCKKDKDTDPDPKVPVLVKIERLEISGWPSAAPDGSGWDPFDAPDIYIQVFSFATLKLQTIHISNVPPSQILTLDEQITFAPSDIAVIKLYDHDDFDADDYMGEVQWTAWSTLDEEQTVFTEDGGDFTVKRIQSYVY